MADQVTISTFLELRDNLSEGMKKAAAAIEAATGRVRKARSDEERAAALAAKAQERAEKEAIRNQIRMHKEVERIAIQRERENAREDARQTNRANQQAKEAARMQERITAAQYQEEMRRIVMAERAERKKVAASQAAARERARLEANLSRNSAIAERQRQREAERAARQIIAAHRRETRERERLETQITTAMWKAKERRIAIAQREAAERKRITDRMAVDSWVAQNKARFGSAGKQEAPPQKGGLFGTMVGASLTANALSMAASYGMRAVRGFYESAYKTGATYEKQISAIAGSIFTQGLTTTYGRAKEKTIGLLDTIRNLAAKLPGEAQDYVKVFTLTLPSALARGITDTQKYAEMVSKYTAIAVQRGYKGQAGYQLNEILQGRVRVTTNMFQVLAPYMGMTSREFNKITNNAERMRIVFNAIERSAGALPAIAKDAESIFGTLKSQLEMLSITGQFPLFESLKIAAVKITEIISGPGLGAFVKDISTALGDLTVGAVVFFKFMFDQAARFANWIGEKLKGVPGFSAAASAFRSLKEAVAFADPFQTMMKIGAEERKKWRSQEEVDIRREGRVRPRSFGEAPAAPGERVERNINFNNNRFEIKQEFAEGFDPDRIAFAFSNDLARLGDMKLQAAYSLPGMVK